MDKRTQIREYFIAPKPSFPVKWLLIGLAAIVLGIIIGETNITLIMVLAGLLIGVIPIFTYLNAKKRYEARPSDNQMDEWLQEDIKSLRPRALKKLGFDEDEVKSEEITITGPIVWQAKGVPYEDILWRVGFDGITRFANYKILIFFITDKGFGIYECIYSLLKNVALNENTNEYFYKNITRVGTREESYTNYILPNGQKLVSSELFALDVAGKPGVEVVLSDPAIEQFTGGTVPTSRAEVAVNAIKKLVREKN